MNIPKSVWAVAAVAVLGAGTALAVTRPGAAAPPAPPAKHVASTAVVERRTLKETITSIGSLGYGTTTEMETGRAGTVTRLPAAGARMTRGSTLFRVDDRPVVLLRGMVPAWRAFRSGMTDGTDVRQLEQNLARLGYFGGLPDRRFDWYTTVAVREWQRRLGVRQTGALARGDVVFLPGDRRVAKTVTHLGDRVAPGAAVLELSGLRKIVTADLKPADRAVAKRRGKVTVNLPGGRTTPGTVSAVGSPVERDSDDGKTVVVPVTVTLDRPSAAGSLQDVSVSVDFPTAGRDDVLTVPVAALLALPGGGYGVEVVRDAATTRTVPVRTGLFAGGYVEVTGGALSAGQKVVVPTL